MPDLGKYIHLYEEERLKDLMELDVVYRTKKFAPRLHQSFIFDYLIR